jgi:hypothetical protein
LVEGEIGRCNPAGNQTLAGCVLFAEVIDAGGNVGALLIFLSASSGHRTSTIAQPSAHKRTSHQRDFKYDEEGMSG